MHARVVDGAAGLVVVPTLSPGVPARQPTDCRVIPCTVWRARLAAPRVLILTPLPSCSVERRCSRLLSHLRAHKKHLWKPTGLGKHRDSLAIRSIINQARIRYGHGRLQIHKVPLANQASQIGALHARGLATHAQEANHRTTAATSLLLALADIIQQHSFIRERGGRW